MAKPIVGYSQRGTVSHMATGRAVNILVQFSYSVVSDSFDPMNCSMPGLPVHHQLLEFTQTHVH